MYKQGIKYEAVLCENYTVRGLNFQGWQQNLVYVNHVWFLFADRALVNMADNTRYLSPVQSTEL